MTKDELAELLHDCCATVSDSITDMQKQNHYPRIVYWSYIWDYVMASGGGQEDIRTYQVSIWGKVPPEHNPALLKVRQALKERGIFPSIRHEYVTEDAAFHSFFSVEVING